jgi:demethylmenaquinone methyltransferase/2-methoxy-6-polyprenyl-1,4-benzoquinol methylase
MGPSSAPAIRGLFERAARTYDLLNHLFSLNLDRRWRTILVRSSRAAPCGEVLDACCGTADLAIAFARRLPVRVVGVDFSQSMLGVGRNKVRRKGLRGRIDLVEGDVLRLPFDDARFAAAAVAFGLRNVGNRLGALREMTRTLKPGAPLLVLEFAPPARTPAARLYRLYLGRVMPLIGGLISGCPEIYRYLNASVLAFPKPFEVRRLMEAAGLRRVSMRSLSGGIAWLWRGERPTGEESVSLPGTADGCD